MTSWRKEKVGVWRGNKRSTEVSSIPLCVCVRVCARVQGVGVRMLLRRLNFEKEILF